MFLRQLTLVSTKHKYEIIGLEMKAICETLTRHSSTFIKAIPWNLKLIDEFSFVAP